MVPRTRSLVPRQVLGPRTSLWYQGLGLWYQGLVLHGQGQGKADRAEARHSKRASRVKAEHSKRGGRAKPGNTLCKNTWRRSGHTAAEGRCVVVLAKSVAWLGSATSPGVLCLDSAGSLAVPCLGSVCLAVSVAPLAPLAPWHPAPLAPLGHSRGGAYT